MQILMIDPLPDISRTFNLVIQEERQRSLGASTSNSSYSMAFSTSPSTEIVAATIGASWGRRDCPV